MNALQCLEIHRCKPCEECPLRKPAVGGQTGALAVIQVHTMGRLGYITLRPKRRDTNEHSSSDHAIRRRTIRFIRTNTDIKLLHYYTIINLTTYNLLLASLFSADAIFSAPRSSKPRQPTALPNFCSMPPSFFKFSAGRCGYSLVNRSGSVRSFAARISAVAWIFSWFPAADQDSEPVIFPIVSFK